MDTPKDTAGKTTEEAPHACYWGLVYIGHMVADEDGAEVEVFTAYQCHRCAGPLKEAA